LRGALVEFFDSELPFAPAAACDDGPGVDFVSESGARERGVTSGARERSVACRAKEGSRRERKLGNAHRAVERSRWDRERGIARQRFASGA
jgi:hypothetical protein